MAAMIGHDHDLKNSKKADEYGGLQNKPCVHHQEFLMSKAKAPMHCNHYHMTKI
jgi:hypothetical protein